MEQQHEQQQQPAAVGSASVTRTEANTGDVAGLPNREWMLQAVQALWRQPFLVTANEVTAAAAAAAAAAVVKFSPGCSPPAVTPAPLAQCTPGRRQTP
jgi:hypothetical protein